MKFVFEAIFHKKKRKIKLQTQKHYRKKSNKFEKPFYLFLFFPVIFLVLLQTFVDGRSTQHTLTQCLTEQKPNENKKKRRTRKSIATNKTSFVVYLFTTTTIPLHVLRQTLINNVYFSLLYTNNVIY